MPKTLLILGVFAFLATPLTRAAPCTASLDPQSIQVNWTAFKTTAKVPVKGAFTEVTLLGELESSKGVVDLLSGLEGEILVKDPSLIRTGNPARDLTLFKHFFSLFKKTPELKAAIRSVKGNELEGSFDLKLTLNQKSREIPMHYRRESSGLFEATGNLDVLDFALEGPFQELHHTCEALHTGKDGISKTWSQVVIGLQAKIDEKCAP